MNPPDEQQANEGRPDPETFGVPVEQDVKAEDVERLAKSLEPSERRQLVQILNASSTRHRGPLPTPEYLRQYEDILPGLAERIVRMPELEQRHRHDFADRWLEREARLKDRGQIFGMVALVFLLCFCGLLAYLGSPRVAGTVAIATVAAVVGILVTGKIADAKSSLENLDDD